MPTIENVGTNGYFYDSSDDEEVVDNGDLKPAAKKDEPKKIAPVFQPSLYATCSLLPDCYRLHS